MNKQIITFTANEQALVRVGGEYHYSSNKVSYIEAHFDLGENWSGFDSVRAVWFTDYATGISTVLDTEGICIVPTEVLDRKAKVNVNLVGSIAVNDVLTDRLTSYPIVGVVVDADAKVDGDNASTITPSEYEQFVASVKADADRAEDAKEDARQYAADASASATEAEEWADKAEQSASDAGFMYFHIDENGHLIMEHTTSVDTIDFSLVNGNLIMEVA